MKAVRHRSLVLACALAAGGCALFDRGATASENEARVTRIVRDVKLLPSQEKPQPAELNDKVSAGTGVRTGLASRSELTFVDLTIERLGASTVFSFNRAGRKVRLEGGSMLLRIPKDSGGATMSTGAVTVGITGTTVILESTRAGRNKLTVLEGGARVSLNKYKDESVYVRGGQMEDVPPGARHLPPPVDVDLANLMENNPLITDFDPLPSRGLILATASRPVQPQGAPGGLAIIPNLIGIGLGPGGVGGFHPGNSSNNGRRNTNGPRGNNGRTGQTGPRKTGDPGTQKKTTGRGTPQTKGGNPKNQPAGTGTRKKKDPASQDVR